MVEARSVPFSSEDIDKYYAELEKKIRLTKGAQFECHKRMREKSNVSLVSLSMLSIYAAFAGSIPIVFVDNGITKETISFINIFVVMISAFILFLNAFEAGKKYDVKSTRMLISAQGLTNLHTDMLHAKIFKTLTPERLNEIHQEYTKILMQCSEDHDHIDFEHFYLGQSPKPPNREELNVSGITDEVEIERKKKAIEQKYKEEKTRYKIKRAEMIRVRINRWIDVNLPFVLFVILPPLAVPVVHHIYITGFYNFVRSVSIDNYLALAAGALTVALIALGSTYAFIRSGGPKIWYRVTFYTALSFTTSYLIYRYQVIQGMPFTLVFFFVTFVVTGALNINLNKMFRRDT